MITLIFIIAVVVVMVIFSVQNAAPVAVAFLSWKFESSLAVIILLSMIIGVLIGVMTVSIWRLKRSFKNRKTAARRSREGEKQP
jgi:lipopolysaccharide assembly protein A